MSNLVVGETVHALRVVTVRNSKYRGVINDEIRHKIYTDIKSNTRLFLNFINCLKNDNKVVLADPDYSLHKFNMRSGTYLKQIEELKFISKRGQGYKYYGPGYLDVQHALLAVLLNYSTLHTADSGFEALNQVQAFQNLEIKTYDS